MAFSIIQFVIRRITPKGKTGSQKTPWRMTGFEVFVWRRLRLRHVESSVRCHRKYKNNRI